MTTFSRLIATSLSLALSLALTACAADEGGEAIDEDDNYSSDGKYEAWNETNNPAFVDGTLIYEVDALPVAGRAKTNPWPGDYWAAANDSINARWDGASSQSPAEKYAQAFNKPGVPAAITNKLGVYGNSEDRCDDQNPCSNGESCSFPRGAEGPMSGACVPGWWGICNGWTGAAISQPAPKKPVVRNGVTFYPGDLEGLMSLVYYYAVPTKYLGDRCDETGPGVDGNGRPREGSCRDMNPGALFVVASNFLGLRGQAFAEDRVGDAEVWNQPVLGFEVTNAVGGKLKEVSASEAANLVTGHSGAYTFNAKAKRFFYVEMDMHYVTESSPERVSHVDDIDTYTSTDSYSFVLECDADGRIIGGEYTGGSKTEHPDFIWWITGKPYGFLPGGISFAAVKEMFDESAGVQGGKTETVLFKDKKVTSASAYATIGVLPGKKLTITMTGSGDADLYLKLGRKPTISSYDKASTASTSKETLTITAGDAGGTYYVRVKPNRTSTVSVTADDRVVMTWTPRSADAAIKKSGVDVRDADGVTPLLAAVRAGDRAWVERLLAAGASLEGHEAQIESLGRRVAEGGRASLLHAAGSAAVAELLLARGLEVDGRDRAGCTPLHLAAHRADRPLVELLLDRGAALEAVDGGGHTALAHSLANLETLRLLLGRGASPAGGASSPGNPDEPGTWSPLTRAAGAGQVGVVEALLAAGARDPLALPVAAGAAAAGVVQRLLAVSVEPEPLRQALVAALAGDGKREARREVVLALLGREETPLAGALHAAATTGEAGYVELLLVRGAEANAVDGQGATALHHAARLGHHQAAEKLLAGGASPVLHDAAGHTPYELAERAYRGEPGIDDARLVMRALATAGGGPSRTREEVLAAGPQVGGQVEHPRFGRGTIVAIGPSDGKLTIDFPSGQRILLPRFVTLLS